MFNMWRKFPKNKPPKKEWYSCTVEVPNQQRYVMQLYWYPDRNKFIDNIRQDIFNTYDVYDYDKNKLNTIDLCDRTNDVIAWKNVPKTYMKGFIKYDIRDR